MSSFRARLRAWGLCSTKQSRSRKRNPPLTASSGAAGARTAAGGASSHRHHPPERPDSILHLQQPISFTRRVFLRSDSAFLLRSAHEGVAKRQETYGCSDTRGPASNAAGKAPGEVPCRALTRERTELRASRALPG